MTVRPLLVTCAFAAALVAVLAAEYHTATLGNAKLSAAASHTSAVQAGIPRDPALLAPDDIQSRVDTILARPLFRSDRRPPASTAPGASGPAGLPRLTGVMVSPAGKHLIFAPDADGKSVVVSEGGRIGPYLVRSIGAGEAIISGPDGTKTVRPVFGEGSSNPVSVAATAPQPFSILERLRNGPPPSVGIQGLHLPPDVAATKSNSAGTQK